MQRAHDEQCAADARYGALQQQFRSEGGFNANADVLPAISLPSTPSSAAGTGTGIGFNCTISYDELRVKYDALVTKNVEMKTKYNSLNISTAATLTSIRSVGSKYRDMAKNSDNALRALRAQQKEQLYSLQTEHEKDVKQARLEGDRRVSDMEREKADVIQKHRQESEQVSLSRRFKN